MQAHLQSSAAQKQTPKLIRFGADLLECFALQMRWKFVEKLGPLKVRGHLRGMGFSKSCAKQVAMAYEGLIYDHLPFIQGVTLPRSKIYSAVHTLAEAIERLKVHHFLPPEPLVRAAFILARQGEAEEVSGCLCHTHYLKTSGPSGLGRICVSVAESVEPGLLLGASVAEVFSGKKHTKVVHSVYNNRIALSRFDDMGGDTCMRVLAAAKECRRPEDYRAWTGLYAKRFGFA